MLGEGAEHALEVAPVHDQEPVEALGAGGADEALGDRVRLRRSHRRLDDSDAFAGEDGVEVADELAVAVADQEPERARLLLERPGELACLLGDPGAGWVGGAAGEVNPRLPSSMKKSTYRRCSEIVSTVKKSTANAQALSGSLEQLERLAETTCNHRREQLLLGREEPKHVRLEMPARRAMSSVDARADPPPRTPRGPPRGSPRAESLSFCACSSLPIA